MKTSLHTDQRGLGHALIVLLIVVVVAVAGFAGWRVVQHNNDSKNKTGSAAQDNCLDVYHDDKLCQFAAANADLGTTPYTAVINSTDAQGQSTQVIIKSDGKGDLSTSSKNGNQSYNTITIGSTVYVQNGGSWIKYTSNAPATSGTGLVSSLKANFSNPGTPADKQIKYKSLGQEKCGQDTCYKYQVINPTSAGTTDLWINNDTNRLVRLTSKSAQGTTDIALTYSPVTITAPSPVAPPSSALDPAQQAEQQAQQQQQNQQQNTPQYQY